MRFLHGKKKVNRGGNITVTFSKPTRVLILSHKEFKRYQNGQSFKYFGGHMDSPYEFTVPSSGEWHVVVEKGSYYSPESITASFTATPPPKPEPMAHTLQEADAQLDAREAAHESEQHIEDVSDEEVDEK